MATYVMSQEVDRVAAAIVELRAEQCVPVLEQAFVDLERLTPAEVDPADVLANGVAIAHDVFAARVALHERVGVWWGEGTLTPECMRSVRRADLAGRYLVDYVVAALPPDARPPDWIAAQGSAFQGPGDLRSGDLLVTRANAVSSAGIAHMGRIDSQFSHNVLVYVDDQGRSWAVMAYLEYGALVQPMAEFLAHGVSRVVVMRHPDAELASQAAAAAYERVVDGPPIDYDADFDHVDHAKLFCSEVPDWAFGELLGRDDDVPIALALTTFDREHNAGMFDAMGISTDITSAPADVLYDPRFAVVAEYRDPAELVRMRHHDAVVESVMSWMEQRGYVLHVARRHRATVKFGLFARKLPVLGAGLASKIHPRGDEAFLVSSLALQEAVLAVDADLEAALVGREEPLTWDDLRAALEGVRVADLARWEADPRDAHFTGILYPVARQPE